MNNRPQSTRLTHPKSTEMGTCKDVFGSCIANSTEERNA
jgi:hypothetical protein